MNDLIILFILLENLVFARVCGWWEGVLDSKYYLTETIAGFKKHNVYMVVRQAFWCSAAIAIYGVFHDDVWWKILIDLGCIFSAILTHFRLLQVGYYHITRNDLQADVSTDRFYQDGDRKSGSKMDKKAGSTYMARMVWAMIGTTIIILWWFCRNFMVL